MPRQIFERCPNLNGFVFVYVPACISGHSLAQDGMWFDKLVGPRFRWQDLYFCVCMFCVNLVSAFAFALGPNILLVVYVFSCSKVCHLCLFVFSCLCYYFALYLYHICGTKAFILVHKM